MLYKQKKKDETKTIFHYYTNVMSGIIIYMTLTETAIKMSTGVLDDDKIYTNNNAAGCTFS